MRYLILALAFLVATAAPSAAMLKNVAGQYISGQLLDYADGLPVTSGPTTVYVKCDTNSQGAGNGSISHVGFGVWLYEPTQAETNCSYVSYTFVNSNAITYTVQTYPNQGNVSGRGSDQVTLTILDDSSQPIADCAVWVSTDAQGYNVVAGVSYTSDLGKVAFMLNAGTTYYAWRRKSGVNFVNPQQFVAVGD